MATNSIALFFTMAVVAGAAGKPDGASSSSSSSSSGASSINNSGTGRSNGYDTDGSAAPFFGSGAFAGNGGAFASAGNGAFAGSGYMPAGYAGVAGPGFPGYFPQASFAFPPPYNPYNFAQAHYDFIQQLAAQQAQAQSQLFAFPTAVPDGNSINSFASSSSSNTGGPDGSAFSQVSGGPDGADGLSVRFGELGASPGGPITTFSSSSFNSQTGPDGKTHISKNTKVGYIDSDRNVHVKESSS